MYHAILKKYWGYDAFRPLQLDIIESIGSKRSTLGLMPTGGGKSITFQVPALAHEGLCLVISPLIALMKDQVNDLRARGIKAAAIYSGMTHQEMLNTLENCELGDYKFLYISPERLSTDLFKNRLQYLKVKMLVVDEAHCISQWGYDFRPAYLKIADVLNLLPENTPILALTATATPEVVVDIQEKLRFKEPNVLSKSFNRPNLSYVVRHTEDKMSQLTRIIGRVPGTSVVYVRSRQKTQEISEYLNKHHVSANFFHAGLSNEQKDLRQNAWKKGACRVMVATNAFGMGIDKADVRSVIHLDLPDSLEAYFQEAGRAGRDEKQAYAILLYAKSDATKLKKRISDTFPEIEYVKRVYQDLANYLKVAIGDGFDAVFPFNLHNFCSLCHLSINQAYNALKILELAGYLTLTDEIDNPSKLMFVASREELYQFRAQNRRIEPLIETLLRSYTGLFSTMTHINEETIAQRLESNRNQIYEDLVMLSKLNLVNYIPFKKTPLLIYAQPRVDNADLIISKKIYHERKSRYVNRIESIITYATSKEICLSQILLRYFGEKQTQPCGHCSVCLEKKANKTANFNDLNNQIISILKENPSSIQSLLSQLGDVPEEEAMQLIRIMLDRKLLIQNEQMKLAVAEIIQ